MTAPANGAKLGFETDLWRAADALRSNMDAAEYKHVVLGLIFLKYISDAFEEQRARLEADRASGADPEDPDEYRALNIFWVPKEARWAHLQAHAKQPTIGKLVDDAMLAIERDNPSLKGVLPKEYAHPRLDKHRLGQLIDLISNIGLGDKANRSKDVLGRVYEYFLSQFASAEGKKGGQFYTPRCIVQLLVEMLQPYKGRVYDPCCGSGGMFVQSEKFVEAHGGTIGDISIYGQESNHTTWRLAKMNLAIRGIDGNLGKEHADSFHRDLHPDLKADYVLANPPFNDSDWRGELLKNDKRWQFGVPPASNANFAWVQHFIYHLAPAGMAGFVLANGSLSSNQSGEGEIRKNIIEADLVDCIVALPGQLFYSTQIPVCLWFIARDKSNGRFRDRRGETLFIDARTMGTMIDRVHRELTEEDIRKIAHTYHLWRGDPHPGPLPGGEGGPFVPAGEGTSDSRLDTPMAREGACAHYRGGFNFSGLLQRARELRKTQTPAETILWELLRDRRLAGLKFRRQHQIGDYIADFYCDEFKLVVELDGAAHDNPLQAKKDHKRDAYMRSLGFTVLRFKNDHVENAIDTVLAQILQAAPLSKYSSTHLSSFTRETTTPYPSPAEIATSSFSPSPPRSTAASTFPSPAESASTSFSPSPPGRGARGEGAASYTDIPGFCKSATISDIRKHNYILTPGRYVGAAEVHDDTEPFDEKMTRLVAQLREQQAQAAKLDKAITANLRELGFWDSQ